MIYRPYLADPKPENMPILADLHKALLDQHIPEADGWRRPLTCMCPAA